MIEEIVPLGDQALLINFPQEINYQVHHQVMSLYHRLKSSDIEGLRFLVPCYCSITIGYDPAKTRYLDLKKIVKSMADRDHSAESGAHRSLVIPVCYHPSFATDLSEISKLSGLPEEKVISLHTNTEFRVFMLGFLPGFPYLGILPKALSVPRKETPGNKIPERSVGIAGLQTGIYPWRSPGGWHIIGSTPLPVYTDAEDPFLFRVGDLVRFRQIDRIQYDDIRADIADQSFDWSLVVLDDTDD